MTVFSRHAPPIPMAVFRKMVATLSPDELARLPPEKLPDNIPADFVDHAPLSSKGAVESLILAANAHHLQRRLAIQDEYGDEVLTALDRARRTGSTANVKIFRQKLAELEKSRRQSRPQDDPQSLTMLARRVKTLDGLLMDVRTEAAETAQSAKLLRGQSATGDLRDTFSRAADSLHDHAEQIEHLLARYYLIRIAVIQHEMQATVRQVNLLDQEADDLAGQIEALRQALERSKTVWRRTVRRGKANREADELQQRISELVAERRAREVTISENDLTLWLDAIVDASLHPFTREKVAQHISEARMALYTLLTRYCLQQEQSARQIARNPFLQVDPAQAIRFMLMSEEFILSYFARKRNQNTAWISNVAQVKMEDLDKLERDILSELKRSTRRLGKK
jgi:flagellar biosynthesis chaperone FliJ